MSANIPAASPPDDSVNVMVDGVAVRARKGAMIIQVTDALANAYVPRFCYHEKLPIAANCRMCLVEVEKAPKPLPACATPVAEGMKIFTKSPNAIAAQKATMEFLLINHPLDCPICDQGGECELQDLAMGFGRDVSRFNERKRVVKDKDLGPLISTDMTRCIHCTRCVRFGQDIAGIQELGTTGRGEHMEIGTYIERSVDHELSGNIIDLCPVGALNSKPSRYRGRSWEMTQHPLVAPHDAFGTNVYAHVLRGKVMRVVPRPNDEINETWIPDRDRFSYEGLNAADRAATPLVRHDGQLVPASWERALRVAADGLRSHAGSLGTIVSPASTLEELYLVAKLSRALGSDNIDHRLRTRDFGDAAADPLAPWLGHSITAVETLTGLLIVGSHLRAELPMLAHRVRKAARRGTRVAMVCPQEFEYLFPVAARVHAAPHAMLRELLGVLAAASPGRVLPRAWESAIPELALTEPQHAAAAALINGERRAIWLGAGAQRHPQWSLIRAVAADLAVVTGASLGVLPEGGNGTGAWLAGCVPHREPGARAHGRPALNAVSMFEQPQRAYLLWGGIEPGEDLVDSSALAALDAAQFVVAVTPFASEAVRRAASVVLPIGSFAETSGTYVNLEGRWQSSAGAVAPPGEARPGWKVARVLANALDLHGFDYQSSEAVRDELRALSPSLDAGNGAAPSVSQRAIGERPDMPPQQSDVRIYGSDALVRRSAPLQAARAGCGRLVTEP